METAERAIQPSCFGVWKVVVRGTLESRHAAVNRSARFCGIAGAVSLDPAPPHPILHRPRLQMAWTLLLVAGLLEICWAIGLKYTDGFTRLAPSVFTLVTMIASVVCLAWAIRTIPVGTGYAVWTGIGAVGTALLGIALFGEAATIARLACIGLIVAGIVGLKVVSG
jgi:quaternary ammonium compound-resistance protein SugE